MKIITKQEIIDWIKNQPDDRPVAMQQSKVDRPCGCVMVQYGREHDIPFEMCSWKSWITFDEERNEIFQAQFEKNFRLLEIFRQSFNDGRLFKEGLTYKQLKEFIEEN